MSKGSKRILLLILAGVLLCATIVVTANEDRKMVLVSGSPISQLSQTELRRLYLGASVIKNGKRLSPLRNESDNLLYEMFLQKVISMSASRYERFLIKRVYRGAGSRLRTATKTKQVVKILKQQPAMVSFMWRDEAMKSAGINIMQPLW